ncbi:glycosyltransferase [Candidatus Roizmanbacteria bacterium CG11_big_fil_rev_8_21_14_0_20_36_8]|uniref:Glycosyltransferase n=1 Tax=Candidatus Roizmanbacteria bacterium CG11_big_fil_rev_8_21_14_0_20_36_8 TaxID=1974856 RepID=A0A2M6IUC3_9BACT|nr:MAG: glycosyltransferase [Candidatus Roizmanbacteria bacterium CG11_big_fil_rev_8_21_14_0_20_36_8]
MSKMNQKISVVVPSYNEAENIQNLHKRLKKVLNKIKCSYEILFVNNASSDNSISIFRQIILNDPHVTLITLSRNFGYQMAISAGLDNSKGDAVVVIDGDLQDPPELIEKFFKKWIEGYDVVYGIRSKRKGNLFRRISYKIFYRILKKVSYIDMPLDASEFALIDKKVLQELQKLPERNRFTRGLRAWLGFKQTGIEYTRDDRIAGTSQFNLGANIKLGFDGIFSFSEAPLHLITLVGFTIFIVSILGIVGYGLYYLFAGRVVPGFLSTVIILLFLGGIQLLSISVIGQYIGRIFEEVKCRPKYIIQEIIRKS